MALSIIISILPVSAKRNVQFFWIDSGVRCYVDTLPAPSKTALTGSCWRGERAYAEAIINSDTDLDAVTVRTTPLKNGKNIIPASSVKVQFVRPVIGDAIVGFNQCGERDSLTVPKIKVFDILDTVQKTDVTAGRYQPVWFTVNVPEDAAPGVYRAEVGVYSTVGKLATLPLVVKVVDRKLPPPKEWRFHLDLWQNPYAVARYHGDELWSKEHFQHMVPVMKILSNAGQKVITTTITNRPWNSQTYDPFASMVVKVKRSDGSWLYDYSTFDLWIDFMTGIGIDQQINCYSLVTTSSTFDYFDAATSSYKTIVAKPGSKEFKDFWAPFIKDFAAHLRNRGLFEKTTLAMDESKLDDLLAVTEFIHHIEPDFKMSLAGWMHPEVEGVLSDLSVTFYGDMPQETLERRDSTGKTSTFYTCCDENLPNTFIASPPAEAEWLPVYAAAKGYDGYLRWAYNSWTQDPLKDARHRLYGAGDCFLVYPNGRSSIRMDKLVSGIEMFEKISILRENASPEAIAALENVLCEFTLETLLDKGAGVVLDKLKKIIDSTN